MTQIVSSILMFVGLACLSTTLAVLVGTVAFRMRFSSCGNRNVPKEFRLAEVRKVTRVNDRSPIHFAERRNTTSARAKAAPAYVPLQIRVRFHREEWRLNPADRLSHRANWN